MANDINLKSIREIPYNHTSYSDKEIIIRILDVESWDIIQILRKTRNTGRSAKMLFEVIGDIWAVKRNPYLIDDLIIHSKRRSDLIREMKYKVNEIRKRNNDNDINVNNLIKKANVAIKDFENYFQFTIKKRKQIIKSLKKYTKKDNILFDGLSRVSHVTDATDWRVEYPFVVICPDKESEIANIVKSLTKLDLTIIPRGGGTGYTGGAVPIDPLSAVINTEKIDFLSEVKFSYLKGLKGIFPIIMCGAGVVTRKVEEVASESGYVFAVDPTSADASCIGGNIAMNAGGKKAVLWGTTLDNLYFWKMVDPSGKWKLIERVNHNFGKIHDQKVVTFNIHILNDKANKIISTDILTIPGKSFRKSGLGKDVTDKFLSGLPGVQKEGTDGIITSACFIVHTKPKFIRTICMEFFGSVSIATESIVEIRNYILNNKNVKLAGLEHLDWRYIRAVGYATKAPGRGNPKMILLADIVSDDEKELSKSASYIVKLANARDGEGFIAISDEARKTFWLDRSRTAAIAKHTNAFKINEDVVIPLEKLGDYSDEIERINIELSFKNKLEICQHLINYLKEYDLPIDKIGSDEEILGNRLKIAIEHINKISNAWDWIMKNLNETIKSLHEKFSFIVINNLDEIINNTIFISMIGFKFRVSIKKDIIEPLQHIFNGQSDKIILDNIIKIHHQTVRSKLFVALHMHAGDGNVHTNIPVNSDDYNMLSTAYKTVDRIMEIAKNLNGVISGEHGIGITKIKYLTDKDLNKFWKYKKIVDPNNIFNRGKLSKKFDLNLAYTPSFELLSEESLILESSKIGKIADMVKNCLRCGKCKPVCATHVPRANLLYSPRNKILSVGLLTEAFLYEQQTRRGVSLEHFNELSNVADHCTLCHRCENPCPVKIDFGDVTIAIRDFLRSTGNKKFNPILSLGMAFLTIKDPQTIKILQLFMSNLGFKAQNLAYKIAKTIIPLKIKKQKNHPYPTDKKTPIKQQVIHFINRPLPRNVPARTMRSLLKIEDNKTIPIIRDHNVSEYAETVFYFPGCGSERLFSQISLATQAMLFHVGVQTVLPPGYLCCGYPQNAGGFIEKANKITTENRVLFHRMANTLNYLDIKTIVVSCGTCYDQLESYNFDLIFPGSRMIDIHEFLLEKGINIQNITGKKYLYHDPCHTPIKTTNAINVVKNLIGQDVVLSDRCCGESGTFAIARPDIATQVKFRKQEEINKNLSKLEKNDKPVTMLTSCPSCLQGLSRYNDDSNFNSDYIVIEIAKNILGEKWRTNFINTVQKGGIEKVIL